VIRNAYHKTSQENHSQWGDIFVISDFIVSVAAVLLLVTISAVLLYYRRIKRLSQEYKKAKGFVDDVVVSINSQFRRQDNRVLSIAQKIEKISLENKKVVKKTERFEEGVGNLSSLMGSVPQIEERFSEKLDEMKGEVEKIKAAQEKAMQKIGEIEKHKEEVYVPEAKIEAAIPIKKERALAPLTDTELFVLETISKEGEKTAPEIKGKVGLTREHTARLMKKLYKDGYLERDTHKMPYIYRLKEEMRKILKRREANVS
jgi:DNA-binding MarR family transcriptional regulator